MKTDYLVISPGRNEADFMPATLDSVIAHTNRPIKRIVVADGPTDELPETLAENVGCMDGLPAVLTNPACDSSTFARIRSRNE